MVRAAEVSDRGVALSDRVMVPIAALLASRPARLAATLAPVSVTAMVPIRWVVRLVAMVTAWAALVLPVTVTVLSALASACSAARLVLTLLAVSETVSAALARWLGLMADGGRGGEGVGENHGVAGDLAQHRAVGGEGGRGQR